MKRSELNHIISESISFLCGKGINLPAFAHWKLDQWRNLNTRYQEIIDNMLGWDITDFGSNDFYHTGLLIFTFRNGNFKNKKQYPKPYAEKLLLVNDGQELPFHYHWSKMEDIINRGGGNLILQTYNAADNDQFANSDVQITMDGEKRIIKAGENIKLTPGQSITLLPGQYHRWVGEKGTGKVILFEVSTVNDDTVDNHFHSAAGRFPDIIDDVDPEHLIFRDYEKYVKLI